MFKSKGFRWGDYPPKWLLREFGTAVQQMGQNAEIAHAFDVGKDGGMSFVVMIVPKDRYATFQAGMLEVFRRVWPEACVNPLPRPDGRRE
jgi:hypothetical protein